MAQPPLDDKLTLDKKYRPPDLKHVYGNTDTVAAIEAAINRDQAFPASVLLRGPSGCGKTTLARIIGGLLGAVDRDLKQYNIANMRGIDTARTICELTNIRPWGACRVIILNECHKATIDFWNTMLEVLEEPPPDNHFILCTTEPEKVINTVRTRCTDYVVELLLPTEMQDLLGYVADAEQATIEDSVISELTKAANGSPRNALVMLDAVIDLGSVEAQLGVIGSYRASEDTVAELCQALLSKSKWQPIAAQIRRLDRQDAESLRYAILAYYEKILLGGGDSADRANLIMDHFATPIGGMGRPGLTQACYNALHV